jgi:hypothetical protein
MVLSLNFVLMVLALLCFAFTAAGKGSMGPVALLPLGLALWVLALLLGRY